MTTFEHEWAAPTTEMPAPTRQRLNCPYCGASLVADRLSALDPDGGETGYYHRHNAQYVALVPDAS